MAPDSSQTYTPHALSRSSPLNNILADGARGGQFDGESTDNERSGPGTHEQEPLPNNEVGSLDRLIEPWNLEPLGGKCLPWATNDKPQPA